MNAQLSLFETTPHAGGDRLGIAGRTNVEKFDNATAEVTQTRGLDYGDPAETFATIAIMQACLSKCASPAIRHAMNMICVKLVRLAETPDSNNLDSIIDVAGYARTIAMILDAEERYNEPS